MEKGEIWLTNLPQIIGKEQIGKRPALIFQIRAIDKGRIVHKIGSLEQEYMNHINKNLKELLRI